MGRRFKFLSALIPSSQPVGIQGTSRILAILAVVIGVSYSVAVLVSVATTGEIGLRCVLGQRVIDPGPYHWNDQPDRSSSVLRVRPDPRDRWSAVRPRAGDRLVDVGPYPIGDDNYHDYVQAMRHLSREVGRTVEVRWVDQDDGTRRVGQVPIQRPPFSSWAWSLFWFVQEMVVFALGGIVYWKRPRDESARLFFYLCAATVGAFMGGYHWTQIVVHPPLIYLFAGFAVFVPILSLHFYLVFPRVNPYFARHWRGILLILYGVPIGSLLGMWTCMVWAAVDPSHVITALGILKVLALGYVWLSAVIFIVCLACLLYSYLRARSREERNQVQWILLATFLSLFFISYLLWGTWNQPARLGLASSVWPMFVVSLLYTAAYATSIMRYKLMQAEVYLNRGVVYFLVSVSAGLLYSLVLIVCTLVIGDRLLAERPSIRAMVAGLTAIVVLVLSEAARHRFQVVIDRRFYRDKSKFDQAMRKMSQAVGSLVDRPTLGRTLLEATCEVLRLAWGAIYLKDAASGTFVLAACHGPEPDERAIGADNPLIARLEQTPTFRVPHGLGAPVDPPATDALIALGGEVAAALQADGSLAGLVVLGPKRSGAPYEDEEIGFLVALASVAALALRSADIQATLEGLNQELHDKVEKIAEQRRRILVLQDQLAGRGSRGNDVEPPASAEAISADTSAFAAIKGSSRAVRRMVEMARKVAASPSAVLIRGESGTGKELLAEAIHRASPRSARPFVKVHCAALSQNLLESELFGHVKGAFTGADRDRVGRFQQADGGTLFLDEIGDINWEVQTKLLRVLQEMAFERVGSSQPVTVDVRLIAATHQDLEGLIRAGRFREDLYYRLNVIPLRTPALRERREDVFELAVHFLDEHARRAGKAVKLLDEAATEALLAYDWPGNIRELENVIERAVVLSDGPAVTLDDLPPEVRRPSTRRRRMRSAVPAGAVLGGELAAGNGRTARSSLIGEGDASGSLPEDDEFTSYERRRLLDALQEAGGNKSTAARLLGMPRSTFFSKLRKHGLV
jgi:transcriptional regulator with GAF, ATPase, and Fis domain